MCRRPRPESIRLLPRLSDMEIKLTEYRDTPKTYESYRREVLPFVPIFSRQLLAVTEKNDVTEGFDTKLILETPIPNGMAPTTHILFIRGDYLVAYIHTTPKVSSYDRVLCKVVDLKNHISFSPCDPQAKYVTHQTLYVSICAILKGDETCIQI